jgi:ABC-type antimicrobial peptide transport system permease subunit
VGIIALIFAEALAPALVGASLGLGLAALLGGRIAALMSDLFLPAPYLSLAVIGESLVAAILLAFLSVILPALKLKRLDVAAVLSGRT